MKRVVWQTGQVASICAKRNQRGPELSSFNILIVANCTIFIQCIYLLEPATPPKHKLDNVPYEPLLFLTLVLLLSHPRPRYPLSLFHTLLLTFIIFLNNALCPIHIHILILPPPLPLCVPRTKSHRFRKNPSHNMFGVLIQTIKAEALALALVVHLCRRQLLLTARGSL